MRKGETYNGAIDGKACQWVVAEHLSYVSNKPRPAPKNAQWREVELVVTTKGAYIIRRALRRTKRQYGEDTFFLYPTREAARAALDPADPLDMAILRRTKWINEIVVMV